MVAAAVVNSSSLSATGRNDFHVRAIKWSYRIRGIVARTQMNIVARAVVFMIIIISDIKEIFKLRKMIEENNLITRILVYSAIKIRANIPLLYSTLNPDTSSDSPSAKSNGVRFVSARLVINHMSDKGINIRLIQVSCVVEI